MPTDRENNAPLSITLLGCGEMGGAMLSAWLENQVVNRVTIIKPTPPSEELLANPLIEYAAPSESIHIDSDVLVLAVKPQMLNEACESLVQGISEKTVILSIAAGKSLATLEKIFGTTSQIVRAMPNLPASIGKGISGAIHNASTSNTSKENIEQLLNATGNTIWVDDEELMHSITAISATGTAYVFYLIEAVTHSAEKLGLSPEDAERLARQTVIGAAALAEYKDDLSAETLRKNVTSKGGTTEAALKVLMDGRFQEILDESFQNAKDRAQELST